MLHGANGSGPTLRPLADALRPYARVETPNLIGHGGRPVPVRFTVQDFAEDVVAYLDARKFERTFLFGYSFGGYVALYVARHFPQRLFGVCTLATNFVFDAAKVRHFTYLLSPERLSRPGKTRPAELTATHYPQYWVPITTNNSRLFEELGERPALSEQDVAAISLPALVISTERDQNVSANESRRLSELLRGRLLLLPGEGHPLEKLPSDEVARAIGGWIAESAGESSP